MAEKALARASGEREVAPGDFVVARVDFVFAHDGTAPLMIRALSEMGVEELALASKCALFLDHAAPSPSPSTSAMHREIREFARRRGIRLYDVGEGICHQVVLEEGYARPGSVVVGADSHTTTHGCRGAFAVGVGSTDAAVALATGELWFKVPNTIKVVLEGELKRGVTAKDLALALLSELGTDGARYAALEYHGPLAKRLGLSARATLANMATEMGAKAAMFPTPEFGPDEDAYYLEEVSIDASVLEPLVATPHSPANVVPVTDLEGVEIDEVFIGSCTNGRLEDLEVAARILEGKRVRTRCIVIPASRRVYLEACRRGLVETFLKAGCTVCPPTCGPCVGAHMGVLGPGEVAISTANRNFKGRMGASDSSVYLASPATAAASAVEGRIADPREHLG